MPRRKSSSRKACRGCKAILDPDVKKCPICGSTDLSDEYVGFVIIVNEEKSEISKSKNIKKGMWAIKVF